MITLRGTLGGGKDFSNVTCIGPGTCQIGNVTLSLKKEQGGLSLSWFTEDPESIFEDCFRFMSGVNWFGGPEKSTQVWPLEKMDLTGPYVIKKTDNFGVAERYWLNSKGTYIFLEDTVPLFVEQEKLNKVCFVAKVDGPYVDRNHVSEKYFSFFCSLEVLEAFNKAGFWKMFCQSL